MTRKHFVAIATTLKALRPGDGVYGVSQPQNICGLEADITNSSAVFQWRKTVKAIADICADQAEGDFNRSTFYKACGFEE